ncbi:MAG: site-2 protease family protein, partial [Steroidobacteraceae bacterium]
MDRRRIISLRIAGIEVGMDPSWMILALLVAWSLATGVFPNLYEGLPVMTYWWMGLVSVLGLAVSIVLHELAHSLVARRFGIQIRSITLFVFGGVADMADQPARPRAELLMAAAGPAMSLALAAALHGLVAAGESAGWPATVLAVPAYLALLNSVLAIFNLVPAFPLDGGRGGGGG